MLNLVLLGLLPCINFFTKGVTKSSKVLFRRGKCISRHPGRSYFMKSGSAAGMLNSWLNYGRMLNYGLAGRSQNVLFNLYLIAMLIATKIEYKIFYIFYSDPLPDLRPDLESVWIFCFRLYVWFSKK